MATNRLNAALDRLPRSHIWCSGRGVPAFRAAGTVGLYAAVVLGIAASVRSGLPVGVALACGVAGIATLLTWTVLRRRIVGREEFVLLEHAWLVTAAMTGTAMLADQPAWPWLDVNAVAVAAFLAFGRLGCLMAGCCHGQPSGIGITYGAGHRYAGIRLFPVPLVESILLALIAVAGFVGVGRVPAGTVFVFVAAAYGVIRIGTESLRGDRRRRIAGVSIGHVMAVAQIGGAIALDHLRREAGFTTIEAVALCAGVLALSISAMAWRPPRPVSADAVLAARDAVHSIARNGDADDAGVRLAEVAPGVSVAASGSFDPHVSVAAPDHEHGTAARLLELAFDEPPTLTSPSGVAHLVGRDGYFRPGRD